MEVGLCGANGPRVLKHAALDQKQGKEHAATPFPNMAGLCVKGTVHLYIHASTGPVQVMPRI